MNYAYKTFYRIFNKLSYLEIPLDAGDFSLMDRKVVNEINNTRERDRFIRGLRAWVGFKQIGVPYNRPERLFGKSTNNFFQKHKVGKKRYFFFFISSFGNYVIFFLYYCINIWTRFIVLHCFIFF